MKRAGRPKLSELKARVEFNGATFDVVGRTAQFIAELVLYEERVNEPRFGKLVAHFSGAEAKLELRERLPSLWLQPG